MGMKVNHKNYQLKLIDHVYNQIPAFTDIFTEETFYMTVVAVVISTIVVVVIVSRYVTLKPVD
ncbi:uncharacterized protein LOC107397724 [Tribolium castaneum]|uniref:uncharacterized protein LOC107397724 n=1 Tax=Tribolium castaneum TaxID=7070 RepID=UPI00077DCD5A|nr:PREDICTED: uncharacterized protein LOC107397724 [Tribolium castaneum]|eukprot:XP_015834397.1 PREDICTED: uncharacterized protein LOC107397724 [Tribolium castaneum]